MITLSTLSDTLPLSTYIHLNTLASFAVAARLLNAPCTMWFTDIRLQVFWVLKQFSDNYLSPSAAAVLAAKV